MTKKPRTNHPAKRKNLGIPRSHGAAKKHPEYEKLRSKYTFDDLSTKAKAASIQLDQSTARPGSIDTISFSPEPGYYLVGYWNAEGGVDYIDWPIGKVIPQTKPA
jgi:hypothetical protein